MTGTTSSSEAQFVTSRLDYNLRMLRWLEHYLQGEGGDPPDRKIDYKKVLGEE
jgi:hypothetical protein